MSTVADVKYQLIEDPEQRVGALLTDRYQLTRHLGSGGMGSVYEALHLGLDRRVAIKLLRHDKAQDERQRERFRREARALARIHSPYIVSVLDEGVTQEGHPFLVMEYLDGFDLRQVLNREHRLSISTALSLMRDAARGVYAAHIEGFVHRDLKPENLFVSSNPDGTLHCRILDFGMVKLPHANTLTTEGTLLGTVGYMAPELVEGEQTLDVRADVFALGAILYECLSGEAAFQGKRDEAVLLNVVTKSPRPLRDLVPDIPRDVEALVDKALARQPAHRYQNIAEFAATLENVRDAEGTPPGAIDRQASTLPEPNSSEEVRPAARPDQPRRWKHWSMGWLLTLASVGWIATRTPMASVAPPQSALLAAAASGATVQPIPAAAAPGTAQPKPKSRPETTAKSAPVEPHILAARPHRPRHAAPSATDQSSKRTTAHAQSPSATASSQPPKSHAAELASKAEGPVSPEKTSQSASKADRMPRTEAEAMAHVMLALQDAIQGRTAKLRTSKDRVLTFHPDRLQPEVTQQPER